NSRNPATTEINVKTTGKTSEPTATIAIAESERSARPPARPSKPSIRLNAFTRVTMKSTVKGTDRIPSEKSKNQGAPNSVTRMLEGNTTNKAAQTWAISRTFGGKS